MLVSEAWWQLAEARKATLEHVREPQGKQPAVFGLEFPASLVRFVLCSGNMDHVYLMICTNLIQFVALCNQSVSGIHVQLQKTASFCMLIARLLDEDIHASHIFLQSECIKVTICNI